MALGTVHFHKTGSDRESGRLVEFDFSGTHEVVAGATVVSAVVRVLLDDAPSAALTLSAQVTTSQAVQVRVTDASAVVGRVYTLTCLPTLSDGSAPYLESVRISVESP